MMHNEFNKSRREFLKGVALLCAGTLLVPSLSLWDWVEADEGRPTLPWIRKSIPSTGELIPVIGMGTWITFNIGDDEQEVRTRIEVLRRFFGQGGGMIDSSPMYGTAEKVLGHTLSALENTDGLFSASKIWNVDQKQGEQQFEDSRRLWRLSNFDLFQVHNLLNWPAHLEYLQRLKEKNIIRYVGITTSHGRRHKDLEQILLTQPLDFVQLTYNIIDREVEERLLPLAKERNVAVIANRPFQGGRLIDRLEHKPLPDWAKDFDCTNWAQFLLKFIVSHPAVTCAIPATSQPNHMSENMGAAYGRLPDSQTRQKMIQYLERI